MAVDLQESVDDLIQIIEKVNECVREGRYMAPRCGDVAHVCDRADHWLNQASRMLRDLQYECGHPSLPPRSLAHPQSRPMTGRFR